MAGNLPVAYHAISKCQCWNSMSAWFCAESGICSDTGRLYGPAAHPVPLQANNQGDQNGRRAPDTGDKCFA